MISKIIDRLRKGPKYRYKSSITGRFVSRIYALLNPSTTYKARIR